MIRIEGHYYDYLVLNYSKSLTPYQIGSFYTKPIIGSEFKLGSTGVFFISGILNLFESLVKWSLSSPLCIEF